MKIKNKPRESFSDACVKRLKEVLLQIAGIRSIVSCPNGVNLEKHLKIIMEALKKYEN